jgi:hypothetical protein
MRVAAFFLASLLLVSSLSPPLQAKTTLPTPPGGGEGLKRFPVDNNLPVIEGVGEEWLKEHRPALIKAMGENSGRVAGDLGGDDVPVAGALNLEEVDMVIDHLGVIHVVATYYKTNFSRGLRYYRSNDGGTTFSVLNLSEFNPLGVEEYNPCLVACEGNFNRVFLFFTRTVPGQNTFIVAQYFTPHPDTTVFEAEVTVLEVAGTDFDNVHVGEDSDSYANYYLYVVAEGSTATARTSGTRAASTTA